MKLVKVKDTASGRVYITRESLDTDGSIFGYDIIRICGRWMIPVEQAEVLPVGGVFDPCTNCVIKESPLELGVTACGLSPNETAIVLAIKELKEKSDETYRDMQIL